MRQRIWKWSNARILPMMGLIGSFIRTQNHATPYNWNPSCLHRVSIFRSFIPFPLDHYWRLSRVANLRQKTMFNPYFYCLSCRRVSCDAHQVDAVPADTNINDRLQSQKILLCSSERIDNVSEWRGRGKGWGEGGHWEMPFCCLTLLLVSAWISKCFHPPLSQLTCYP